MFAACGTGPIIIEQEIFRDDTEDSTEGGREVVAAETTEVKI